MTRTPARGREVARRRGTRGVTRRRDTRACSSLRSRAGARCCDRAREGTIGGFKIDAGYRSSSHPEGSIRRSAPSVAAALSPAARRLGGSARHDARAEGLEVAQAVPEAEAACGRGLSADSRSTRDIAHRATRRVRFDGAPVSALASQRHFCHRRLGGSAVHDVRAEWLEVAQAVPEAEAAYGRWTIGGFKIDAGYRSSSHPEGSIRRSALASRRHLSPAARRMEMPERSGSE